MSADRLDNRIEDLLRTTDCALSQAATKPILLAQLRAEIAHRTARRNAGAGLVAAIALFAALGTPARFPGKRTTDPTVASVVELDGLMREADQLRALALAELAQRDRLAARRRVAGNAVQSDTAASRCAAVERAAFILYCEADRLAQDEQTSHDARDRYAALAELFPDTIWARLAHERIAPSAPNEKG